MRFVARDLEVGDKLRLVGELHDRKWVAGPDRVDEVRCGLPRDPRGARHAAGGIKCQHDGNRRHRFMKDVHLLWDAVLDNFQILAAPGRRTGAPDRWR